METQSFIHPLKIGSLQVPNNVFLAPLAGYTDSVFRQICKNFGAGLVFTEMVSIEALYYNSKKTLELLRFKERERPIGIQLFGGNPSHIAKAMRKVEPQNFDLVDFNAGCPVKKVLKARAGAYLLTDLPRLRDMLCALRDATDKPLTLKTRIGWDNSEYQVFKVLEIAQKCGVSMLTVHTRTRAEGFGPILHLDILAELKRNSSIPIVGNGGIDSLDMAERYFREAKVDAIMIGSKAFKWPWIFREVIEGRKVRVSFNDVIALMREHLSALKKAKGEIAAYTQIKKFLAFYSHGLPFSSEFRQKVFHANSTEQLLHYIAEFETALDNYEKKHLNQIREKKDAL